MDIVGIELQEGNTGQNGLTLDRPDDNEAWNQANLKCTRRYFTLLQ